MGAQRHRLSYSNIEEELDFFYKYQYHGSEISRDLSILSPRLGTQNLYGTN